MDKDVNSPPRHSAFSNYYEFVEFLMVLQELSGGKPVGFKLCLGRHSEFMCIVKAMLEVGFVTVCFCNSFKMFIICLDFFIYSSIMFFYFLGS
jgi:hypothetical protein